MAEKGHRIDPWDFKELIQIQDIEDLTNELSGKAPINHTHTTIEVNGLTGALDGKAAIVHGHAVADVVGLQAALDGKADDLHGHAVADVVGLQAALDGKADDLHGHAVADVVGLQAALDGKADDLHGHAVADVVGLQAALDGKADDLHGHAVADVVGLQAALDGKADDLHGHAVSDVVGLQAALDGKADAVHNHDGRYALISHTHPGLSSAIGSIWIGLDQVEPYGVLFLDGGTLDGSDPEYSDFADFLLDPAQAHLVQPANLAAFDVDSVTREIRLPDVRGLGLRLAGLSAAFQMANGAYYDGGALMTVLLDQMQGWQAGGVNVSLRYGYLSSDGHDTGGGGLASGYSIPYFATSVQGHANKITAVSDGTNGPIRSGPENRGASVSLRMGVRYK